MTSVSYSFGTSFSVVGTTFGPTYNEITGTAGDDILGFPFPGLRYFVRYSIKGLDGNDRLFGDVAGDILDGGRGTDILIGNGGNDSLFGGLGKDLLKGGDGYDKLDGGKGNDTIKGGKGDDTIEGGYGYDTLFGGFGSDELFGGDGIDTLNGGAGRDIIKGGKGDDTIIISNGRDKIDGGLGYDTLDASELTGGVVVIAASSGKGLPSTDPGIIILSDGTVQKVTGIENFIGSSFDDTFYGSAENSVLRGRAGDDRIETTGAGSKLVGGGGDDRLETTGAGSKLVGGGGDDRLRGNAENIELFGGKGADTIKSFGVGMKVLGGRGDDTIAFSEDTYYTYRPESIIRGGAGDDTIKWLGSDYRPGFNTHLKVFGGAGADVFDFGDLHSGTIQDFQTGIDRIDISVHLEYEDATAAQLLGMITDTSNGAVLTLDFWSLVEYRFLFVGVQADDFTENDFIF